MQYKKNTFRFATFAAALGLGMGLLVSGCGDSGSTTPNSLNGGDTPTPPTPEPPISSDTYKVTFQYNSLAKNLGRIDVASDIVNVKYAFYGKADNKEFTTVPTKAQEFKHEATAQEQDIIIDATKVKELGADIYGVTAAYYDESDNLVAVGYDTINWQDSKTATITDPDLYRIGQGNDGLSLTSYDPATGKNKTVFKPGENVGLSFKFLPNGDTTKPYDLTPFATFSKLNDITDDKVTVLTAQDETQGQFTAASKGTAAPQAAIGDLTYMVEAPIYVTEQTITKIELCPASEDITALPSSEVTAFYMLSIAKKDAEGNDIPNASLGQKVVTMGTRTAAHGFQSGATVGVDEVPMQVIATYTNEDEANKGPQPQDVNIIDQVELKTTLVESASEPLLKAQNGSLIATGTIPESYADRYEVIAKYGDKLESKNFVYVLPTTSEICFARYFGEDVSVPLAYVPDNTIPDEGDGATINEGLRVVGHFQVKAPEGEDITESVPFYIDNLISEYPEALVKNEPFTEASGNIFKRDSNDGGNSYFLKFTSDGSDHELTVADFSMPLPKFVPLKIEVQGWTPPKL